MTDCPDPHRRQFLTGIAGAGLLCAGGITGGLMLAPDTLFADPAVRHNILSRPIASGNMAPTTGTVIRSVNQYKQRPTTDIAATPNVPTYRFAAQEPDLNIQTPVLRQQASIQSGIQSGFHLGAPARQARAVVNLPKTRGLWAYNANVGEHVKIAYVRDGYYDPGALTAIDWLLRDHHYSRYVPMSRRLYDVLYVTQYRYGFSKPLVITSGYRTPRTNQLLAERVPGVGRRSYHLRGQAVDFHVPGVPLRDLANFLLALGVGGVGLYPRHVHVDVGPLRSWA